MQAQHQLGLSVGRRLFSITTSPALFKDFTLHYCFFSSKGAANLCQSQEFLSRSRLHSSIEAFAALQEKIADSSAGFVKVKFVLRRRCEFGQQFNLVGDDDSFGAWNPEASIPMQWSEGHVWTTQKEVSVGKRIEYKVILIGGQGVLDWQPGPNRVLEPLEPQSSPVVFETQWVQDDNISEKDIQLNSNADAVMLNELATPGQISPLTAEDGVVFPGVHSDEILEETKPDLCEQTSVDRVEVEMITEVQEELAAGLVSEEFKVCPESKPTVLENDLRWAREALSMLWNKLTQPDNNSEV